MTGENGDEGAIDDHKAERAYYLVIPAVVQRKAPRAGRSLSLSLYCNTGILLERSCSRTAGGAQDGPVPSTQESPTSAHLVLHGAGIGRYYRVKGASQCTTGGITIGYSAGRKLADNAQQQGDVGCNTRDGAVSLGGYTLHDDDLGEWVGATVRRRAT